MRSSQSVEITETSQVGSARRKAMKLAEKLGFSEDASGRLSIVVTEIANNLVNHARSGELIISELVDLEVSAIEILSIDKGPGMANIDRCSEDGYSTHGTPGNGLGAIKRLSDDYDIYSQPGVGTILFSRIFKSSKPSNFQAVIEYGGLSIPMTGETQCGDAWNAAQNSIQCRVALVDGLGHGSQAAEAADLAMVVFTETLDLPLPMEIQSLDRSLRATRGAVMAIAQVDCEGHRIEYCGVGNISSVIISDRGESKSMVSLPGTLGHRIPTLQLFSYDWPVTSILIMQSDGLTSHWSLSSYIGIKMKHPSIIAAALYRDHSRGRDDVTVVAARWKDNQGD